MTRARLVGELPNLRERLAKAQLGWKGTAPANQTITVMSKSRGADFDLLAASPSAHAIAIEAIERLERVEKALEIAANQLDDAGYYEFAKDARAALAAEPDRRKG